jgi:hypothetical protein
VSEWGKLESNLKIQTKVAEESVGGGCRYYSGNRYIVSLTSGRVAETASELDIFSADWPPWGRLRAKVPRRLQSLCPWFDLLALLGMCERNEQWQLTAIMT